MGMLGISTLVSPIEAHSKPKPSLEAVVDGWKKLDHGLHFGKFKTRKKSKFGDSKISVLRINPRQYSLHLMLGSEVGKADKKAARTELAPVGLVDLGGVTESAPQKVDKVVYKTADQWAQDHDLVAVINAGMFEPDGSGTGYLRNFRHASNSHVRGDYNAIFAFNPRARGLPSAMLIDKRCDNYRSLMKKYSSLAQSIRMISCKGNNVWQQQRKWWSQAAVGMTKRGEVLFIHSRSPYSVHDFIDELLRLPLGIKNAMYLEGGPEASLYIRSKGFEFKGVGSYETGFNENNDNRRFWDIPNVIGIKKK